MKTGKKKILLVEDTIEILQNLAEFLQMEGFEITTAGNGKEALLKLSEAVPDLIITDLLMPLMTGFELIKELKNRKDWSKIPILVFSARPLEDETGIEEIGADRFILKPSPPDDILKIVKELIN